MDNSISSIIPDPKVLIGLEPEELAAIVIAHFNSSEDARNFLHPDAFCSEWGVKGYPREHCESVGRALMEAWIWLEHEGLIARKPGGSGWYYVTRRGERMKQVVDMDTYRKGNLLPKNLLHPVIAHKVSGAFLRGDYDTCIFQAFKDVEIAVRNGGHFSVEDLGVPLMRKAFDPTEGLLTNPSLPDAEKQAMAHLFAGAIGLFKNPQSHRSVSIDDPAEAVELLFLASHLLRIVGLRSSRPEDTELTG